MQCPHLPPGIHHLTIGPCSTVAGRCPQSPVNGVGGRSARRGRRPRILLFLTAGKPALPRELTDHPSDSSARDRFWEDDLALMLPMPFPRGVRSTSFVLLASQLPAKRPGQQRGRRRRKELSFSGNRAVTTDQLRQVLSTQASRGSWETSNTSPERNSR